MATFGMFLLVIIAFIPLLLQAQIIDNENELGHIVSTVKHAGGCCGPVDTHCGTCTPKAGLPGIAEGHGCCFPRIEQTKKTEKKANGPTYWCCRCGYPALQPNYGQPCCAGHC